MMQKRAAMPKESISCLSQALLYLRITNSERGKSVRNHCNADIVNHESEETNCKGSLMSYNRKNTKKAVHQLSQFYC